MPTTTIFISAKSEDYEYARKIYAFLAAQGFSCFFSDESLFEMGQAAYKAAIDAALDAATHMVVVASSRRNAESKWVKYEWNTFANEQLSERKEGNLVTVLCGSIKPADLPIALRQNHALIFDKDLQRLPRLLGGKPPAARDSGQDRLATTTPVRFEVSDYELIEPHFAAGAHGKVWLARNAVGQWQALKGVFLNDFNDPKPYEREFNGIKRFMPISHRHPGLLRVDFVSRKKDQGLFYYVMELADSCVRGWEVNPALYKPRDLAQVQREAPNHRLPLTECARIGVALADALHYLHQQNLTHGEVKPSNILFVNGRPKLGDVGLVAEVRPSGVDGDWVITPDYRPPMPESPGTIQADVYALGMVLYVISTGLRPKDFPEITGELVKANRFMQWSGIIIKACHPDQAHRYATAAELHADLRQFQNGASESPELE